jgi:hypothetical protein
MKQPKTKTKRMFIEDDLTTLGWNIQKDIVNKKKVKYIEEGIEKRVVELCNKFAKGNTNMATLPAFWLGLQSDIDRALIKAGEKE